MIENMPQMRLHNGKELFTLNGRIDAQFRRRPKHPPKQPLQTTNADSGAVESVSTAADDGMVRSYWRLLSAVVAWPVSQYPWPQRVNYGYNGGSGLKPTVNIINSKKPDFLWDHWSDSTGLAGRVESAEWENSEDIPPGVNGVLTVDPVFDPKMARGLEKGIIRHGSIGVLTECERSHPEMELTEFMTRQGEIVGGKPVEWLVVNAVDVEHFSALPAGHGADPNVGKRGTVTSVALENTKTEAKGIENQMEEKLMKLVLTACKSLGMDLALSAGAAVPDGLETKISQRIEALNSVQSQYNSMAQELQSLAPLLKTQNADKLTAVEIIRELPARLEMAGYGDAFLQNQRDEAVRLFDAANVDPANAENMTDLQKRQRERLANCRDLQILADSIEENRVQTENRFENRRSSSASEDFKTPPPAELDAGYRKINAQFNRWAKTVPKQNTP